MTCFLERSYKYKKAPISFGMPVRLYACMNSAPFSSFFFFFIFPFAFQCRVLGPSSEVLPCHCYGPSFLYCLSLSSSYFFCHPSTLFLAYLFLSFLLSLPLVFVLVFYLPPSSPGVHTISTFFLNSAPTRRIFVKFYTGTFTKKLKQCNCLKSKNRARDIT